MKQNKFPPGWDEERVQKVIDYYENQTEDEAVAEDEEAFRNESMNDQSDPQNELNRVLEKIQEIVNKSADRDYMYRGEPEEYKEPPYYGKVSSSLYRSLLFDSVTKDYKYTMEKDVEAYNLEVIGPNLENMENGILEAAKEYLYGTNSETVNDFEILAQLQHYGCKTNLIDFTTDYLIALFFACDKSYHKDGRVVLLKKESEDYQSEQPSETIKRGEFQKSILVRSPKGSIDPDVVVIIPKELKYPILNYLAKYHDISMKKIYEDVHGFIKWLDRYFDPEIIFAKGVIYQHRASLASNGKERLEWYEKAVECYTEALELQPDAAHYYDSRGEVYRDMGELELAFTDFNKVIDMTPNYANSYSNRGVAHAKKGECDRAMQDFDTAIDLDPNCADFYNNRGITYKDMGKVDLAMKDYNKALDLNSQFPEAYNNVGIVYNQKGEYDHAIENFAKAIELRSCYPNAYNNRGRAYRERGDIDLAIEDFRDAIIQESDFAEAYYNLCEVYLIKGDFERAYTDLTKLAIFLSSPYACFARGIIGLCQQQWEQAIADFTVAKDNTVDIVALFSNGYKSIEDFEKKNNVQIPENITAMLRQQ